MAVQERYLEQVPFPEKMDRPEYERGERLLVPAQDLYYPGEPYRLRRLALPHEQKPGVYALETSVDVEDTEELGRYFAVTFSWEMAQKATDDSDQSPEASSELEVEDGRAHKTIILSAAGYVLAQSMPSGTIGRLPGVGYFLDIDEGHSNTLNDVPRHEPTNRPLARV
jgi:hypothetical protein